MAEVVVAAILDAVLGELARRGLDLLRRDPERRAFKTALREAGRELVRAHPGLADYKFAERFLTGRARPILARALLRDEFPRPEELGSAYLDELQGGAAQNPDTVATAMQMSEDFLVRFHLGLRRQSELRSLFDSRALDASASYLNMLVSESRLQWVRERELWVTEALAMYGGAARLYELSVRDIMRGRVVEQETLASAYASTGAATTRLKRVQYSDFDRLH